jgi:hypothetical protein
MVLDAIVVVVTTCLTPKAEVGFHVAPAVTYTVLACGCRSEADSEVEAGQPCAVLVKHV